MGHHKKTFFLTELQHPNSEFCTEKQLGILVVKTVPPYLSRQPVLLTRGLLGCSADPHLPGATDYKMAAELFIRPAGVVHWKQGVSFRL